MPPGPFPTSQLHIQGGTQLLDQLFLGDMGGFLATNHLENLVGEGFRTMLPDQLLQGKSTSLDHGVINVVHPPNVKALLEGPTPNNGDPDIRIPGHQTGDQVDDMVAIRTTLAERLPVDLATRHSLIIA